MSERPQNTKSHGPDHVEELTPADLRGETNKPSVVILRWISHLEMLHDLSIISAKIGGFPEFIRTFMDTSCNFKTSASLSVQAMPFQTGIRKENAMTFNNHQWPRNGPLETINSFFMFFFHVIPWSYGNHLEQTTSKTQMHEALLTSNIFKKRPANLGLRGKNPLTTKAMIWLKLRELNQTWRVHLKISHACEDEELWFSHQRPWKMK